ASPSRRVARFDIGHAAQRSARVIRRTGDDRASGRGSIAGRLVREGRRKRQNGRTSLSARCWLEFRALAPTGSAHESDRVVGDGTLGEGSCLRSWVSSTQRLRRDVSANDGDDAEGVGIQPRANRLRYWL